MTRPGTIVHNQLTVSKSARHVLYSFRISEDRRKKYGVVFFVVGLLLCVFISQNVFDSEKHFGCKICVINDIDNVGNRIISV